MHSYFIYPMAMADDGMRGLVAALSGLAFSVTLFAVAIVIFRRAGHQLGMIRRRVASFCVRDALCFVEDDREFVEANISELMKKIRRVPYHATREECLNAFDELV